MDSREEPPPPPPTNSYPPPTTIIPPNQTSPLHNSPSYLLNYGDGSFSSSSGFGGMESSSSAVKKKRGRPRKYSPEGSSATGQSMVAVNVVGEKKKGRGRPPGSSKKQQLDVLGGPAGISFTPHFIIVKAGEDICSKIMAFSQQGPRSICILSANGAISNASICHSSLSGGTVTYEGRYEIISLKGSFTPSESNIGRSRMGGLNVTLSGPDGQVLGGSLSGMLIAASPVQIIVGSFIEDGKKPRPVLSSSPPVANNMLNFNAPVAAVSPPISQEQPSSGESSDGNSSDGSPYDGGSVPYNTNNSANHQQQQQQPPLQSMPMYSHSGWVNGP